MFTQKGDNKAYNIYKWSKEGGYCIITGFTENDPGFKIKKLKYYLKTQELVFLFENWKALTYKEFSFSETSPDQEEHNHACALLVA